MGLRPGRAREISRPNAGPKPLKLGEALDTLGSLLPGAASAHVFGHDGVITDLQLGVIHRQQTAQPGPRRHAHDARPQMPAAAKAAALPTRTKSLSSQLHQTLLMEIISIRMRKIVRRTLSPTTCLWLSSGCHQMLGSKPIYFRSMLICPIGIGTARGLPGANHVGSVR